MGGRCMGEGMDGLSRLLCVLPFSWLPLFVQSFDKNHAGTNFLLLLAQFLCQRLIRGLQAGQVLGLL